MMDHDLIKSYTEEDLIEVIPLAYMRGRTLNEAFIILDEAQNTTVAQMKMFLTRMGAGSKIVVSGDVTQIDLPPHAHSGLVDALSRLHGIDGIGSVKLAAADIVRHPLVQKIVHAYEEHPKKTPLEVCQENLFVGRISKSVLKNWTDLDIRPTSRRDACTTALERPDGVRSSTTQTF